jgi:hypothetical protein
LENLGNFTLRTENLRDVPEATWTILSGTRSTGLPIRKACTAFALSRFAAAPARGGAP